MKILLIGGNGFIGRNILEKIGTKYDFAAPRSSELDLLDGQIVKNFLGKNNFGMVIHSANIGGSRSQTKMQNVFESNKKMFLNLAENRNLFDRMIFFGSGAEYGKHRPIVKVKEEEFGMEKPQDEYGRAKYFASEYIKSTDNIISLRMFGVFGKYEDYKTRFISNAICHAIFDMPIVVNQNVLFDYLYVNDLAKIVEYFFEHKPKEKFYNIGIGQPVDLLSIAQIVKEVSGKNLEIIVKNSGLNKEYTCDNSFLKKEIPDLNFTPLKQAVGELYGWYEQNKDLIDKIELYI